MTGVAWYINDMKRKHEHAVRVQVRPHGTNAKQHFIPCLSMLTAVSCFYVYVVLRALSDFLIVLLMSCLRHTLTRLSHICHVLIKSSSTKLNLVKSLNL